MGIIRIKPTELDSLATKLKSAAATVSEAEALAASVESNLAMEVSSKANILAKINTAKSELKRRNTSLTALSKASSTGAGLYKKADKSKLKVVGISIISKIISNTNPVIKGGAIVGAIAGISAIVRKIFEDVTKNPINPDATTKEIQNIINGATDGGSAAESATGSASTNYRSIVDSVNQKVPKGQIQQRNNKYTKDTPNGEGLCTYASTTTILMRKNALEGKDPNSVTFGVVYNDCKEGEMKQIGENRWTRGSGSWVNHEFEIDAGKYEMHQKEGATSENDLISLLDKHPEGVMLYTKSSKGSSHAVTVTDYEVVNGKVQFYVSDPSGSGKGSSNTGRIKIEDSWLANGGDTKKSTEDLLKKAISVSYLVQK